MTQICPAHHNPCDQPTACDGYCDISTEPLNTASDTGHKVAHGKRIDYMGKAADESIPADVPNVNFPSAKVLLVDFGLALVYLVFWPVMAGIVVGTGYGVGRFFNIF